MKMGPKKQGKAEDVSKLKVAELKGRLEALGESTTGKKADLVARLTKVLMEGGSDEPGGVHAAGEPEAAEKTPPEAAPAPEEVKAAARPVEKANKRQTKAKEGAVKTSGGETRGIEDGITKKKLTASQRMNLKKKMRKQKQREARKAGEGKLNDNLSSVLQNRGKGMGEVTYTTKETASAAEVNMSEEVCVFVRALNPAACQNTFVFILISLYHSLLLVTGVFKDFETV